MALVEHCLSETRRRGVGYESRERESERLRFGVSTSGEGDIDNAMTIHRAKASKFKPNEFCD